MHAHKAEPLPVGSLEPRQLAQAWEQARWHGLALGFEDTGPLGTVLAHCLQNANYFRFRLSQLGNVKLVAQENQGPSVGFKIYNPEWVSDPEAEFAFELARSSDPAYKARLQRNTDYHRSLFKGRGKVGLYTNWVEAIAHSDYDARGNLASTVDGEKVTTYAYATDTDGDAAVNTVTVEVSDDVPTANAGPALSVVESAGASAGVWCR